MKQEVKERVLQIDSLFKQIEDMREYYETLKAGFENPGSTISVRVRFHENPFFENVDLDPKKLLKSTDHFDYLVMKMTERYLQGYEKELAEKEAELEKMLNTPQPF